MMLGPGLGTLLKLTFGLFIVIFVVAAYERGPPEKREGQKSCRKCGEKGKPVCPSECDNDYTYEYCEDKSTPIVITTSTPTSDPNLPPPPEVVRADGGRGGWSGGGSGVGNARDGEVVCYKITYDDTDFVVKGCTNNYTGVLTCFKSETSSSSSSFSKCYCRNDQDSACNVATSVKPSEGLLFALIIYFCNIFCTIQICWVA